MPQSSVHVIAANASAELSVGNGLALMEPALDPGATNDMVSRAKDFIAGRVCTPALVAPPEIDRLLQREFQGAEPPTGEAIRRITERLRIQAQFGGLPVACCTTANGDMAVLASGEREIEALLRSLSADEAAMVVVTDSEAF